MTRIVCLLFEPAPVASHLDDERECLKSTWFSENFFSAWKSAFPELASPPG